MIAKIKSSVNGEVKVMNHIGASLYETMHVSPESEKVTDENSHYPIIITAEDEAGNITVDSNHMVTVMNNFEFSFITAQADGVELGYVNDAKIDVDIGKTNDFEIVISTKEWDTGKYAYGNQLYIPGTEYGGIVEDLEVATKDDTVSLRGYTWRGLLMQKIIEPPAGQAYLRVSGDLNKVIGQLLKGTFDDLFIAEEMEAGVAVTNWQVERYARLYDVLLKLLGQYGHRLEIRYIQGNNSEAGKVHIRAAPIKDVSNELEYSQDACLDFNIRDCRSGINHLICGGAGELEGRLILHLYVQLDGSIGYKPYYTGLEERTAFYSDTNADTMEKLEEGGRKQLKDLQNYKKMQMFISNIDLEVGDIVGGREYITKTELKKPVARKIFRQTNENVTIEYELKGEE